MHLAAGIGNLVLATPLLVALHRMGFAVDLLLHADYPQAADLFAGWSLVRRVHAGAFPHGERYAGLVPAVPPFAWPRLGRGYAGRPGVLARPSDALFWRDEQGWYLAFAEGMGWPAGERPACTLPVAPSEEHGVTRATLVLAPGCKTGEMAAKRWPHFAALAERFADVAVVGTGDDLREFDGTPFRFPGHVRTLADRLTLRQTAEALAAAGAVVANDSGLGHVAAAVGAPTVLLFGPTCDRDLGGFPPNVTVLRAGLACEPCWQAAKLRACSARVDCLRALDVDRVEREVHARSGLPGRGDSAPHRTALVSIAERAAPAIGHAPGVGGGEDDVPLVSCLMPTRDRRRYAAHAVELFLRQDHPRRELVVVDDGADAVEDLLPPDPRIRYHRVERQRTLGGKRNLACSLARGELLAHWDDDDWAPARRLSAQVRALQAAGTAEVCGLATLRFFEPMAGRAWEYRWPPRSRAWVAGGTMLFRRRAWEQRPFPELDEGEDTRWLWSLPPGSVAAIPDPGLYAALVHAGNTSRKHTGGPRWHPIPLPEVVAQLGSDWHFYATCR
ncbi:MAG TPA: glycosyltransferase family 9 protein [Longimicrobium sp.]|nr:glycosyltransferase family 9 protein [Longimicrobium sp.]